MVGHRRDPGPRDRRHAAAVLGDPARRDRRPAAAARSRRCCRPSRSACYILPLGGVLHAVGAVVMDVAVVVTVVTGVDYVAARACGCGGPVGPRRAQAGPARRAASDRRRRGRRLRAAGARAAARPRRDRSRSPSRSPAGCSAAALTDRARRRRRRSAAASSPTPPTSRRALLGVDADLLARHGAGRPRRGGGDGRRRARRGSARRTAWRRPASPARTRRTASRPARCYVGARRPGRRPRSGRSRLAGDRDRRSGRPPVPPRWPRCCRTRAAHGRERSAMITALHSSGDHGEPRPAADRYGGSHTSPTRAPRPREERADDPAPPPAR